MQFNRFLTGQRCWLFITITLLLCAATANAQSGSSPLRLIVPFSAGSYTDNVARILAPALGERLNTTVVVENRAGANGIIGADLVSKAAPDGLTLLVGGASVNTINPGLYKKLPYDPVHDLQPVARIGILPFLLLTHPDVPVETVAELITYAKRNPGKLAYGTPNAATLVGMETFKRTAGVEILSVPYKSSPQAIVDLVGNQVQVLIADFATAMPQVRAGKVRLLAVTMKDPSELLPNVPSMNESVNGFDLTAWTGLLAPANTPSEVVNRISEALIAALGTTELREKLATIGFDVQPLGPKKFGPYLEAEMKTWNTLIEDAGIERQ